jgi:ribosomal protein S18 acetylase RimI-like enzyme
VEISDGVVHITASREGGAVREAAAIWAHATAHRDQVPEPSTVEETAPGILRRLRIDGAKLLLARRNDQTVGFTLFAPRTQTLEIFYLAVAPDAWGDGVGSRLLVSAEDHAREIGREMLELWVITENERAIRVYERSGFVSTQEVKRNTPSDRLERRFLKQIH